MKNKLDMNGMIGINSKNKSLKPEEKTYARRKRAGKKQE